VPGPQGAQVDGGIPAVGAAQGVDVRVAGGDHVGRFTGQAHFVDTGSVVGSGQGRGGYNGVVVAGRQQVDQVEGEDGAGAPLAGPVGDRGHDGLPLRSGNGVVARVQPYVGPEVVERGAVVGQQRREHAADRAVQQVAGVR